MTGMMRVPRSRGAFCGLLLILLGAWGGLVPFVGPHFHYAYTPDTSWTYTSGRLLLEILPGAATALGGLIVLGSRNRPVAMFGAWLAALSGAWFAVGGILSTLWTAGGVTAAGTPVGGIGARVAEQIGFFTGLGLVIAFLGALALGRFAVVGVKETRIIAREQEAREQEIREQEAREQETREQETRQQEVAAEEADAPATAVPATVTTPAVTAPARADVSPEATAADDAVTADEGRRPGR
ncbi:MAG: hypothetical protein M3Y33_15895 [Actinomycetota bacterium]|nr:hypothetical protein [Actinomycetota bacterium]